MSVERISTFANDVQPSKTSYPIKFTEEGITMLVNDIQSLKERYSISNTDEGISTFVSEVHLLKVPLILVTEEGIDICFNDENPAKVLERRLIEHGSSNETLVNDIQ